MDSEDLLFLMYTSGTTAKPKGCQHSTGGYLAYVNDAVVGWCNANRRVRYTTIGEEAMPMQENIGAIV